MLHGITWIQFIGYLGGALVLYYAVLFVMSAKDGLVKGRQSAGSGQPPNNMVPAKKRIWRVEEIDPTPVTDAVEGQQDMEGSPEEIAAEEKPVEQEITENDLADPDLSSDDEPLFDALESLAANVQQTIVAAGRHPDKPALLVQLQDQIARFPELNHHAFRVAINRMIIREAQLECLLSIHKDEADALWNAAA